MKEKRNKVFAVLGVAISFFVLAIFVVSIFFRKEIGSFVTGEATVYGYISIALASAILEFFPQFISPTILVINAAVLKISLVYTTIWITIGSAVGAYLGFLVGKKYGKHLAKEMFGEERVDKTEKIINSHGRWFVALAALTPLPYVAIIFGALGMTKKNIIIYGLIPRAISYVLLLLMFKLGFSIIF